MTERLVTILVHVYRQPGRLLSRFAHDLELGLEELELQEAQGWLEVRFSPAALRVRGALLNGVLDTGALDPKSKLEVERNIQREVLNVARFPTARFRGQYDIHSPNVVVSGDLELCGVVHPIVFELVGDGSLYSGQLSLVPSRWGIPPFQALLGALKLQDRVEILFRVEQPSG